MRYRIYKPDGSIFWYLMNDKGFIDVFGEFKEAVEFMKRRSFAETLLSQINQHFGF